MDPTVDRNPQMPDPQRSDSTPGARATAPTSTDEELATAIRALKDDLRELARDAGIVLQSYLDRFGIELRALLFRTLCAVVFLVVVTVFLSACAVVLLSSLRGLAYSLSGSSWFGDFAACGSGFALVGLGAWAAVRSKRKTTHEALVAKYADPPRTESQSMPLASAPSARPEIAGGIP